MSLLLQADPSNNIEALSRKMPQTLHAFNAKLTQFGRAKKAKHRSIISAYLDADARREGIEAIRERNQGKHSKGQDRPELRDIIAAAQKRDEDFQRLRKLEAEAPTAGLDVFLSTPRSTGAEDCQALAKEIAKRAK